MFNSVSNDTDSLPNLTDVTFDGQHRPPLLIRLRWLPHSVALGMCFSSTEFRCNRLRRLCAAPPNLSGGFQNFACIEACDSTALGLLHNPIAPTSSADCPILFSQLFSTSGRSYHSIVALFTTQHTILAILRPSSSTPIEGCLFSLQFLHQLTCVFSLVVRLYPASKPICR